MKRPSCLNFPKEPTGVNGFLKAHNIKYRGILPYIWWESDNQLESKHVKITEEVLDESV